MIVCIDDSLDGQGGGKVYLNLRYLIACADEGEIVRVTMSGAQQMRLSPLVAAPLLEALQVQVRLTNHQIELAKGEL